MKTDKLSNFYLSCWRYFVTNFLEPRNSTKEEIQLKLNLRQFHWQFKEWLIASKWARVNVNPLTLAQKAETKII